jgi:hypothetical protein
MVYVCGSSMTSYWEQSKLYGLRRHTKAKRQRGSGDDYLNMLKSVIDDAFVNLHLSRNEVIGRILYSLSATEQSEKRRDLTDAEKDDLLRFATQLVDQYKPHNAPKPTTVMMPPGLTEDEQLAYLLSSQTGTLKASMHSRRHKSSKRPHKPTRYSRVKRTHRR